MFMRRQKPKKSKLEGCDGIIIIASFNTWAVVQNSVIITFHGENCENREKIETGLYQNMAGVEIWQSRERRGLQRRNHTIV